jgi:hypothetical protein
MKQKMLVVKLKKHYVGIICTVCNVNSLNPISINGICLVSINVSITGTKSCDSVPPPYIVSSPSTWPVEISESSLSILGIRSHLWYVQESVFALLFIMRLITVRYLHLSSRTAYLDLESAVPVMSDVVILMNLLREDEFLRILPDSSPGCKTSWPSVKNGFLSISNEIRTPSFSK